MRRFGIMRFCFMLTPWQHKRRWLGAFVRYDNLQGVSFADSPLFQRQHNASFGVVLAWIFNQQGYFDE
ncbi:MipA/OmpV family protein [Rheinheimera nanhaiensis]|uniref:Uncharacterized protein n=1 Tax=Rheinheimera nanhaiensis E407-8 TaxID=562729 RepID=I1E0M5_9GAMM|nr:MipA/OmpV family protein [Rheinheimera nanhaiensis]GAB59853.1 hypothetical protein RNAN_2866 [Rheinheimera nanhaiensis E407-8]